MERLPPTAFGRTLRVLIRNVWKTQCSFAQAIAVDETWVAKIIRGDQENLTYSSLGKLLAGFTKTEHQELLYGVWVETYAPSPLVSMAPEPWSSDEDVQVFAGRAHDHICNGRILPTYQELGRLWSAFQHQDKRTRSAFVVGSAFVEAAQHLDRIDTALSIVGDLLHLARSANDPEWIVQSLWLQGVATRLIQPHREEAAEQCLASVASYLESWQPQSANGRQLREEKQRIVKRDQTLAAYDLSKKDLGARSLLDRRVTRIERITDQTADPAEITMVSEIIARSLILLGKLDRAEEWLRLARQTLPSQSRTNAVKLDICQVQLLVARGQVESARSILWKTADIVDSCGLVHHRHKLAQIERQLRSAEPRQVFSLS